MAITGNKPKTNVEKGLYTGRKSGPGPNGTGEFGESGLATPDPTSAHGKGYGGDVPAARRPRQSGDTDGMNRFFDHDSSRKGNAAPISKDGGNTEKSPFSDAAKATKAAESDWDSNYKPNKVR
jgi:hypothetical protein